VENFITAFVAAVLMAPFIWPPFVMIYRYFRDLEDQRFARRHDPAA
jgi:hypothetical protein